MSVESVCASSVYKRRSAQSAANAVSATTVIAARPGVSCYPRCLAVSVCSALTTPRILALSIQDMAYKILLYTAVYSKMPVAEPPVGGERYPGPASTVPTARLA